MSSMLRVIQQRCAFHKPLISKPIYSYALPQSELLGNGAITPGQTLLLEDIAVDTFVHSSFGTMVMTLFHSLFTAPSWETFTSLTCGWALATDRHTITTYLWLTGVSAVKHFSRFYFFLGGAI